MKEARWPCAANEGIAPPNGDFVGLKPPQVHRRTLPALKNTGSSTTTGDVKAKRYNPPSMWGDELILVTGATGYVGGRLVPRLLEAGYRVRCLVRDRLACRISWYSPVEVAAGDALEPCRWRRPSRMCTPPTI